MDPEPGSGVEFYNVHVDGLLVGTADDNTCLPVGNTTDHVCQFTSAAVTPGDHTFEVNAVDKAGNVGNFALLDANIAITGDVNLDGNVDRVDLRIVSTAIGTPPVLDSRADLNRDEVVDVLDLARVAGNLGRGAYSANQRWH
jgi:hypothetical protein